VLIEKFKRKNNRRKNHFKFQMDANEMRVKVEEAKARRLAEEKTKRQKQLAEEEAIREYRVVWLTNDALTKMSQKLEFPYEYHFPFDVPQIEFERCAKRLAANLQQKHYETEIVNKFNWDRHIIIRLPYTVQPSRPPDSSRINSVSVPNHPNRAELTRDSDAPPRYQDEDKPPEYSDDRFATNPHKCCYL
jgi:hypothetical protein